jgi:hypothetical protein
VPVRAGCTRATSNAGTFTFTFAKDANGLYPAKIDTHQLGGGFNGHFWFAHTRTAALWGGKLQVTGTWQLTNPYDGLMRVYIALPDHGAQTPSARYIVRTARGDRAVVVNQSGNTNRWVSLGIFPFNDTPRVTLSTVTPDGDGTSDIAYDAVAFVPAG